LSRVVPQSTPARPFAGQTSERSIHFEFRVPAGPRRPTSTQRANDSDAESGQTWFLSASCTFHGDFAFKNGEGGAMSMSFGDRLVAADATCHFSNIPAAPGSPNRLSPNGICQIRGSPQNAPRTITTTFSQNTYARLPSTAPLCKKICAIIFPDPRTPSTYHLQEME
jgi:hypothetical protein